MCGIAGWIAGPESPLTVDTLASMLQAIAHRVPFLDHSLVEFVSTLPDRFRVRGLRGKWILRQAAKRLIPARILKRPKVGFRVPVDQWFRGEMREFLRDHLQGACR